MAQELILKLVTEIKTKKQPKASNGESTASKTSCEGINIKTESEGADKFIAMSEFVNDAPDESPKNESEVRLDSSQSSKKPKINIQALI